MSDTSASPSPAPSPENSYGIKGSPMGGWLVVFIAMYVISAAQGLLGLWPAFQAAFQLPRFASAFLAIVSVIALWNIFILYSVLQLILQKPHAVRVTKLMLATGPVIAALTPMLGAIALVSTMPDAELNAELIKTAYTPEVFGQISGMLLLSAIWYRYFCVAKRVKAIWGQYR
ncbi:hypothetical protein [Mailhella sp.]|uniref:hypothetical protein n=1 Tax=Mailhella sp. TaxID=1981029 RepID=UPI004063B17B